MLTKTTKQLKKEGGQSDTQMVKEILFGKTPEAVAKASKGEKMAQMGRLRSAMHMQRHQPDKPTDLLKNHFFGTPLRQDSKIEQYDPKAIELERRRKEQIMNMTGAEYLQKAMAQRVNRYVKPEYAIRLKRKSDQRIFLQLAWIGHSRDVLLGIHLEAGRHKYSKWFEGWRQEISWKTAAPKERSFLIFGVLVVMLFMVEVPLTVLRTFFAPKDLILPGLTMFLHEREVEKHMSRKMMVGPEDIPDGPT